MVSVVIPTYNRASFLQRAIKSVLKQSKTVNEIIIIDDGSTDNTKELLSKFPQVKYIYQKNSGVSSSRNRGIKEASSEWIAFLDSDDEWHKNKIEKQLEYHSQNSELFISYTDEKWIKDNKHINIPKKFKKIGGSIFNEILPFCNIAPSSVIVKKELFESVGYFDEELEVCEDYDLWLRIARSYEFGLVNEPLITKYAGHDDQLSFKHWGMDRFRIEALKKHTNIKEAKQMLIKKLELLLIGAKKYNKTDDIRQYEEALSTYQRASF
ncbi:MAG: glycosyltransferase [Helicobacteraceae bacterium]|nr:glycosyltransferase [Helicobacteraceae bacterium]